MKRPLLVLAALAILAQSCATYAQVLTVKMGDPVEAKATEPPHDADDLLTAAWAFSDGVQALESPEGKHLWYRGPGSYWWEVTHKLDVRETRDILVPGPNWATDKADVKQEKLTYLVDRKTTVERTPFIVEGVKPPDPPPPDPDEPPPGPTSPATAATYIYEKDATPIPTAVSVGLNRLNREKKIRATLFEEDTKDGDGDVPDQYVVPLAAAQKVGLPALIITAGAEVLKVVKDPRTVEQVFEAIAP